MPLNEMNKQNSPFAFQLTAIYCSLSIQLVELSLNIVIKDQFHSSDYDSMQRLIAIIVQN